MNTIEEKEIIIGIDLGDGEVSAAYCYAGWENEKLGQLEPVKDITLHGNSKVIPSAIRTFKDGSVWIGTDAIEYDKYDDSELRVSFKKAPTDIHGDAEQLMIKFMGQVYELIKEKLGATLTATNHIVYIAAPSGWDEKARDLYYKMAQRAGIPIGGVTQESRAAFVKAQKDNTTGVRQNASKGVIVFDMGSSTLDFTYMNNNRPKMIDFGYECGASLIEKSMYVKHEKENEKLHTFLTKYPKLRDSIIYEMRKIKEKVYTNSLQRGVLKHIHFETLVPGEDGFITLKYNTFELNKFLHDEIFYIQRVESALSNFKAEHLKGNPIYSVLLTGGASRMDFLNECIKKCWGSDIQIHRDQDPSLTISQGVAEVARIDLRTRKLSQEINEEIDELISSARVYDNFAKELYSDLIDYILEDINTTLDLWWIDTEESSINDLQAMISKEIADTVNLILEDISEDIENAITEATSGIEKKIQAIISAYNSQGVKLDVPKSIDLKTLDLPDINFDEVMKEITQAIKEKGMWDDIFDILMYLGPLGWLIGLIGEFFRNAFGENKTEEEKEREAKAKKLSATERYKAYSCIKEKWPDIEKSIRQSLSNAIYGNDSIKKSINTISQEYMKQYRLAIQKTQVLIY